MGDSLCPVRIVLLLRWALESTENAVDDAIVGEFGEWHNIAP
jgi:hypothetical protein